MQFGLLGSLEVRRDDGSLADLGGVQPRKVLALLLAASGRVVPVDSVIEEVWGEEIPASASGTLQSYISRLRRAIDPERSGSGRVLAWEPPGYRLDVPADEVDFRRFERLAREGRQALDVGDSAGALALLAEAESLWRGDALVEFADEDFARGLAARLGEGRLAATEDRIAAELALGRHAAVIGELRELLDAHHLREGLWSHLALAMYRSGRQADALRVLGDMRDVLLDELGVDPSPPLRRLEQQILEHDPSLLHVDPPPAAAPPGPPSLDAPHESPTDAARDAAGAGPSAGFIGRAREVDALDGALDDVWASRSRFVVIEGEAGIGKTRLLEELERRTRARGGLFAWGRCREGGTAPSFWPWLEILQSVLDQLPPVPITAEEGLRPLLNPLGGNSPIAEERFVTDRFSLFHQATWNIERASETIPLVLVVDDVQWADPASLQLIDHLAGALGSARALVALAVRTPTTDHDDALFAALSSISRRPTHARLVLQGLSADETRQVVAHAIGREPRAQSVEAIHERAEGNPFFIGELVRLVSHDPETSADDLVGRRVPTAVGEVVRRRLSLLPEDTIALLEAAAVLGREAEIGVLARVADRDLEASLDAAEPALAHHVLVEPPGSIGTFRFAHALVRDAVLTTVSTRTRARLHRRAAEAIIDVAGDTEDTAEIIAHHLVEAVPLGGRREAAQALERAADIAEARYAYETAFELLERAVVLRGSSGSMPSDLEAELLAICRLTEIRRRVHGYNGGVDGVPLERARQLADRTGRHDLLVELLWAEWAAAKVGGDLAVADQLAAQFAELAVSADDPVVRRLGSGVHGIHLGQVGRTAEAAAQLDIALQVERDAEGRLGEATIGEGRAQERDLFLYGYWALTHEVVGDLHNGSERFAEVASAQPGPYYVLAAMNFDSYAGAIVGDVDRAARAARRAMAADPDVEFPFFTGGSALNLAWALSEMGEIEEAADLYAEWLPIMVGSGIRTGLPMYHAHHALVHLRNGKQAEAEAALEQAVAEIDAMDEQASVPVVAMVRAEVRLAAGNDRDEIARDLADAVEEAERAGALALVRRARRTAQRLGLDITAAGQPDGVTI